MQIYGIYRTHANRAYGGPIAVYRASGTLEAWNKFCAEFSVDRKARLKFKIVAA